MRLWGGVGHWHGGALLFPKLDFTPSLIWSRQVAENCLIRNFGRFGLYFPQNGSRSCRLRRKLEGYKLLDEPIRDRLDLGATPFIFSPSDRSIRVGKAHILHGTLNRRSF